MLYFLVALFASALGSVTGIGGGLIIRPALTVMGFDVGLATFTSAASVFVMSCFSIVARRVWKTDIEMSSLGLLAVGSIAGAFAGAYILSFLQPVVVSLLFILFLMVIGALLIAKKHFSVRNISNPWLKIGIGLVVGVTAGLFGIGGGLMLMIALMYLFGSKPKEAVVQSLFVAMLASAAALIQYVINGFADFSLLVYVLPGSILGSIFGLLVAKRMQENTVVVLLLMIVAAGIASQVFFVATY